MFVGHNSLLSVAIAELLKVARAKLGIRARAARGTKGPCGGCD